MKKLLFVLCASLMGFMTSCSYDDGELWETIDRLQEKQDELKENQEDMQDQIDAQQALINALANNLTISSVTETSEGYIITFSDGSTIVIKHGEKGDQGEPGDSYISDVIIGDGYVSFIFADGNIVNIHLE